MNVVEENARDQSLSTNGRRYEEGLLSLTLAARREFPETVLRALNP